MGYLIIDTNVPIMAAKSTFEDDLEKKCSHECLNFISKLISGKSKDFIVLDSTWDILKEYENNIDIHGDRSIATEFLLWVYQNQEKIKWYQITKIGTNRYEAFPVSEGLKKFDASDRKFVALSKVCPMHPPIYDGSDTDWWEYRDALESEGIRVVFLCEDYVNEKARQKKARKKRAKRV